MNPADLAQPANNVVNAFGQTGGILGLIILALLAIVGLVAYMGWNFMNSMMKNHELRMDKQEDRHKAEQDATNQKWQEVTREITTDMKEALVHLSSQLEGTNATIMRIDRAVETLKRRKAA